MRILMVSKACVVGAYQRKLEEIGRHEDVDLTVVVPPAWRENGRTIRLERQFTQNYELVVDPMALNGRFHLHFYPGLRRHIHRVRPDIVHIDEEPYNMATFQSLWLAKRVGAKTLFFTWQNIHRHYPPPFCWTETYVLRHADAAIAGNREAADVITAKGYQGPVDIIPQFGVDPDIYRPMPQHRKQNGQAFTIGYIGRLVPEKGIDVLLQAIAGLDGRWHLKILGAGRLAKSLQQCAASQGLAQRITLDAARPSQDIPKYLNGLDVLVLPSRTQPNWKEQFGRVLIEAMACGVPVIGSTCGEIPNVIGEAGLTFPEGDACALRGHLARLMQEPDLRSRFGRAGRARVLSHYTQHQIAIRTVALYRQLMKKPFG